MLLIPVDIAGGGRPLAANTVLCPSPAPSDAAPPKVSPTHISAGRVQAPRCWKSQTPQTEKNRISRSCWLGLRRPKPIFLRRRRRLCHRAFSPSSTHARPASTFFSPPSTVLLLRFCLFLPRFIFDRCGFESKPTLWLTTTWRSTRRRHSSRRWSTPSSITSRGMATSFPDLLRTAGSRRVHCGKKKQDC